MPTLELKPEDSILDSIKILVDVPVDYDVFDTKLLMYINSVMLTLDQLDIGPDGGFYASSGEATWADFLGEDDEEFFSSVRTYVGMCVSKIFDPPQTSHLATAQDAMIEQSQWRMLVKAENRKRRQEAGNG